ncbi:hypothetical protein [Pseudomonas sp. SDO52101_S400]
MSASERRKLDTPLADAHQAIPRTRVFPFFRVVFIAGKPPPTRISSLHVSDDARLTDEKPSPLVN